MLHDPAMHESLQDARWDAEVVRTTIRALVADVERAYDGDQFWPPANEWDAFGASLPLKDVFVGAAGVVWALDRLQRSGQAETALDLKTAASRALTRCRAEPVEGDVPRPAASSLLIGQTGVALVAWLLDASDELATDLLELVRANVGNEANELMWGVPGTLLAARAMHARTGEERWRAAVEESERALRAERDDEGLWTQRMYGQTARVLGPVHGFVGNVAALGDTRGAADVLARHAIHEDGRANWPSSVGSPNAPRLQWCHGAPGIITTASGYLDEELLLAAAELVWEAGPLSSGEKGAGICHGTAGNGYAFLKTFERTGDELWLGRARAFALHALAQAERLPGRYTLFTGGIGAAIFAADCLDERARFPFVDGIE